MPTKIFLNLPVKDLNASMAFFGKLGFSFNPQFTNDQAACMIVSDTIFVMLLGEEYFVSFTKKEIPDTTKANESIAAISVDSREKVDELVHAAFAAGATKYGEPQDHGFMYVWSFQDLDGHLWEFTYLDESALAQQA